MSFTCTWKSDLCIQISLLVPSPFPHLIYCVSLIWKFWYIERIKAQSHQVLFQVFTIQKDTAVLHWSDISQKVQVSKRSSDELLTEDSKWKMQGGHLICKNSQYTQFIYVFSIYWSELPSSANTSTPAKL